ncbi:MAG: glycosyltransferase family 4 protein [Planctomycetia bacterium]|nr:glycosyltransferase family 4 protein [Planctomycetia bacterium]
MISARRSRIRIVDVFNTDHAARALGMRRAELINQSGRYENLIVCTDGPCVPLLRQRGIRVFTTPIPRRIAPLEMLHCAREIARLVNQERCSVIHSHGSTAAACARLAARRAGVGIVVHTVHGFHFHQGMNPLRRAMYATAERLLTQYTDLLLFQNQEDLDESRRYGIRARRGNVKIGNGIDLRPFASLTPEGKADPPAILMIGRFERVKNQTMLLRAAKLLAERGDRFQLWFAGKGVLLEKHRQLAAELGLADRVHFFGYCQDVMPHIRRSTIAALTSIKEGIPRGLLEPMAAGLPVVTTDVKGNRETVVRGKTGFLVPLDDAEALARALHELLQNAPLREQLGAAGAHWVRQNFDEDRVVDRLLNVYDSLLAPVGTPT